MKKESSHTDKLNTPQTEEEKMELLAGKFAESRNHTPEFSEELSDGGVRNKMAEEQLKRITIDEGG